MYVMPRFLRKCPWLVDLENMAMPSARSPSTEMGLRGKAVPGELCTFFTNVQVAHEASKE